MDFIQFKLELANTIINVESMQFEEMDKIEIINIIVKAHWESLRINFPLDIHRIGQSEETAIGLMYIHLNETLIPRLAIAIHGHWPLLTIGRMANKLDRYFKKMIMRMKYINPTQW